MLNFLRKLRRPATAGKNEMKSTKYIKYAVGEIFLVVIGILIALSINNWNEGRKAKVISIETMKNLQKEISTSLNQVNRALSFNTTYSKNVNQFIYGGMEIELTDSLKSAIVYGSLTFAPLDISIPLLKNELTATRKISQSSELSNQLASINELITVLDQLTFLWEENWRTNIVDYLNNTNSALPFYGMAKGLDQYRNGLSHLYDKMEFKNLISMQQMVKDNHNKLMADLRTAFESLDSWLEKHID